MSKKHPVNILIIAPQIDPHMSLVRWALKRGGLCCDLLDVSQFPRNQYLGSIVKKTGVDFEHYDIASHPSTGCPYDSVWFRRFSDPKPNPKTHPDDMKIVVRESELAFRNMFPWLGHDNTLWVNHPDNAAIADQKVRQLLVAQKCGFDIPDTYIGNSPQRVRELFQKHGERVIYKAFKSGGWINEDGTHTVLRTSRLSRDNITNDFAISACPGIYQEEVAKSFEVRVTVMGDAVFSVMVDSQQGGDTVDWRYDFPPGKEPFMKYEIPTHAADRCRLICRALGLKFAAIDLIVRPDGKFIFLELNQAGQFLFAEYYLPDLPLLEAFVKFISRDSYLSPKTPSRVVDYFESAEYVEFCRVERENISDYLTA